jgi:nitrate/nitrite transporter NarK
MITYLDRVCFGSVAPYIQSEFALSDSQLGYLFTAFALAYAAFEVPSGWLGDVYGPRRTLIRIVVWWSAFTALSGLIWPFHRDLGLFVLSGYLCLLMVRFLFGAGEAGAYPNISRAFHNWFPFSERGSAQGAVWMAGRFGGGITPLVVLGIIYYTPWLPAGPSPHNVGSAVGAPAAPGGQWTSLASLAAMTGRVAHWRHMFWVLGGLGVLWCVGFWFWFRDRPDQHPSVNVGELDVIRGITHAAPAVIAEKALAVKSEQFVAHRDATTDRPPPSDRADDEVPSPVLEPGPEVEADAANESHSNVPWWRMVASGNLWLLCLMYFCGAYGWYFNITWLPKYLKEHYDVTADSYGFWTVSLLTGAPLLLGSLACLVGGLLTDWFIRRTGNRKWGRRLFGVIGHGVCALCWFLTLTAGTPYLFVMFVALAAFWNDLTMGSAWASCLDIGRKYSGIVSGCMNTIGNLGGAVAGFSTGQVLDHIGTDLGWRINFLSYGAVYVVAVFLWLRFDATKSLVDDEPGPISATLTPDVP